jgi:hypothetical protein
MTLYQNLLRNHPDLGAKLLELFRDECALHARQGRRYSLEHFCEDLSDELWAACNGENIPTTISEKGKVSA